MSEKILRLENITMQFGGVIAVNNMNLEVGEGEIVSPVSYTHLTLPTIA